LPVYYIHVFIFWFRSDFVNTQRDARRAPPGSKSWWRHCQSETEEPGVSIIPRSHHWTVHRAAPGSKSWWRHCQSETEEPGV